MKFRRKSATPASDGGPIDEPLASEQAVEGPYDADTMPVSEAAVERVDLGSILVAPVAGRELRLQVDEKSGAVQAVLIAAQDGALELRAFAAPRSGDLWGDIRPQLAADVARRGGQWSEREGRWGTELMAHLPVKMPDGSSGNQVSRIIGINGPRWLLRATLLGRPAVDEAYGKAWEDGITGVVVRRGSEAKPVGEALPLTLPPGAQKTT